MAGDNVVQSFAVGPKVGSGGHDSVVVGVLTRFRLTGRLPLVARTDFGRYFSAEEFAGKIQAVPVHWMAL